MYLTSRRSAGGTPTSRAPLCVQYWETSEQARVVWDVAQYWDWSVPADLQPVTYYTESLRNRSRILELLYSVMLSMRGSLWLIS